MVNIRVAAACDINIPEYRPNPGFYAVRSTTETMIFAKTLKSLMFSVVPI